METIILFKQNNSWMSSHLINGMPHPMLAELFGTHELPTAFTDKAEASEVMSTIKRLNPNAIIKFK